MNCYNYINKNKMNRKRISSLLLKRLKIEIILVENRMNLPKDHGPMITI